MRRCTLLWLAQFFFPASALICLQLAAQTGPPLAIQVVGTNQVQISWPPGTNFNVLEELFSFDTTSLWREVSDAPAVLGIRYQVDREATNDTTFFRLASRGVVGVSTPPDPAAIAPSLSPNTFNDQASSTAFLYSGPNAIQVGVPPGTIDPIRSAVLRGKVKKRDNSPLPAVRVAILNHPEFGYTYTRSDGMFDLAVNAALYTIDFQAIGYFPVHRPVQAPIQDFRTLKDTVMVGFDTLANPIVFGSNAPLQFAHSSINTDQAGTRSVSIMFPAGTCANLVMPDRSTQACNNLTIRATEFTVGTNGPAAMPAPLPSTSAYTYCAEFSGDEAVTAGARTIVFNQTVWGYLDNFLAIPVGAAVPAGSYDRQKGAWVPESNGRVIRILGVSNGLAQVDTDGSGTAADNATLAANQFNAVELQQLAANYTPGKTLWRMPMAHFTPIDWNFGFSSNNKSPNTPGDRPVEPPDDLTPPDYGTVNYSSQVFEEAIPLVGMPMALHYSSARVPGYRLLASVQVPVVGGADVPGLVAAEVHSEVAGVVTDKYFSGATNFFDIPDYTTISWDGYDAYGRFIGGTRHVAIETDFYYPIEYSGPVGSVIIDLPLFANFGNEVVGLGHTGRGLYSRSAFFERPFTIPDHRSLGLGGWSLTPHHLYDPESKFLYMGNGRVIKPKIFGTALNSLPGLTAFAGKGSGARNVAAGADGTLFFSSDNITSGGLQSRLYKRTPDGNYVNISASNSGAGIFGVAEDWSPADGKPASQIFSAGGIGPIMTGPDGSLYIRAARSIARIDPGGTVHIVLGMAPAPVFPPDGTLGRAATCQPSSGNGFLAVGSDGTVFYDDAWRIGSTNYTFIRKIAPDSRIYTVMGQAGPPAGSVWRSEVGKPADQFRLYNIQGLAVGPDGSIYISPSSFPPDEGGIYKITPDGRTELVMANIPITTVGHEDIIYFVAPGIPYAGDEGSSAVAPTNGISGGGAVRSLQVAPDGSLLFLVDWSLDTEVWRITPNGIRERLAGRGVSTAVIPGLSMLQGGNPLNMNLYYIYDFAVGPDNGLTFVTQGGFLNIPFGNPGNLMTIAHVGPSLPDFNAADIQIPSEDGRELFIFNEHGRHLVTLNGLTGATNWVFSYDASNLVTDLTDGDGLVTHIQRDGSGKPTAIVGPYGQQTALSLDASGFLDKVTNPAGEATMLTNSNNGLLTSITGPLNHSYLLTYDTNGLVAQVRDPLGGGLNMTRTDIGSQVSVQTSTTLSNVEKRALTLRVSGDTQITSSSSDGSFAAALLMLSGHQSIQSGDGASAEYDFAGDPRFPQNTRLLSSEILALPGDLTRKLTVSRSTTLSDPNNPGAVFSIAAITNQATLNGQLYTLAYNGTNRVAISTSPEGRQTMTRLDERGRLIHFQFPGETPVDISYDSKGRISEVDDTSSLGVRRISFAYDAFGQLHTLTDPLGRTNQYTYDAAGRLQQLTLADGQVARFQNDAEFHLTSVTPPGRPAHHFDYNQLGVVTNYTPPPVNGLNESVIYQYNADRALTRVLLPDGQNVDFTRGPDSRIDQLALGSGPVFTYSYSTNTGLLTNVLSTTGDSLSLGYQGPFPLTNIWSGKIHGLVARVLNSGFLPASETVNDDTVPFTYNHDQLLTKAGNLTLGRDTNGFVTTTSLGVVTDVRQFDERGLLTNYAAQVSGTNFWSVTLSYDFVDRLTNKIENIGGTLRTFSYAYDLSGRVATVWRDGALFANYTYDANGNRLTRNSENATYDAQDRVQTYGGATFGWSVNGTLLTRLSDSQTTTYASDAGGSLTSVVLPRGDQISYDIDPMGHRIGRQVNGVLERAWLWDDDRVVAELDGKSSLAAHFVYGADDTTPSYMIAGANTYRILSDERGSVRLVVNITTGSINQQLDYDEFGRVAADSAPGFQPFGFAGGLYDSDTGLVHFGARDYSAETGQWMSRDPISFSGGLFSLYSYVDNDPLNRVDISGSGPNSGHPRPDSGLPDIDEPSAHRRATMALNEAMRNENRRINAKFGGPITIPRVNAPFPPHVGWGEPIFEGGKVHVKHNEAEMELTVEQYSHAINPPHSQSPLHGKNSDGGYRLVLPQGGNLQSIGGDISGIGGPSTMQNAPIPSSYNFH